MISKPGSGVYSVMFCTPKRETVIHDGYFMQLSLHSIFMSNETRFSRWSLVFVVALSCVW